MSEQFTHPGLKSSSTTLGQRYELGLLDLDGVVYRGKNPVDNAAEAIVAAEKAGMFVSYTTNNSSRYQQVVADQLKGFGLSVEPRQIITSSVVAARMVAHHVPAGSKVLPVGAEHLRDEVRKAGLVPVDSAEDKPDAVLQGWYPKITWEELAQAAFAVEAGAAYFVTNRDLTIPRELGIAPGSGSLINAVITATGVQPVASAGKPESAMYDEERALAADDESQMVSVERSLPVGDRLDTDIEAANRGGYDSLVVLTGVADAAQLMLAEPIQRPTYISQDLRGLNQVHVAPQRVGENRYRLGSMTAQYSMGTLSVAFLDEHGFDEQATDAGSNSAGVVEQLPQASISKALHSLDALRAACALAWDLADRGIDMNAATLPSFGSFEDGE